MPRMIRRGGVWVWLVVVFGCAAALVSALSAVAAGPDSSAPVLSAASLSPAPDGNGNWYRSTPVTLRLSATDDVEVAHLQYSLDGGLTFIDAPVKTGSSVSATVPISQQGNTGVRYRAIDSSGNYSAGDPATVPPPAGRGGRGAGGPGGGGGGGRGGAVAPTTLSASATAGATAIRLSSTDGRAVGEKLVLGSGANQETVTIDRLVPDSPGPNVMLQAPLAKGHAIPSQNGVFLTYRTIPVLIDNQPPVAAWPAIVDDKVPQSQTLTPTLSDPRRQTPTDPANGSGGIGIWRMEIDGKHVFPFPQQLNTFTVGAHSQTLALQDVAGNAINYTRAFVVTTSFADLDAVITEYATNALSTMLAVAATAGETGLRLSSPFGFRTGQTLIVGTGSEQETVTIASVPSPPPPQQGANVLLTSALKQSHAAGNGTPVSNPRPLISSSTAANLRALLKEAGDKAAADVKPTAIEALRQFNAAVLNQVKPEESRTAERAALTSAGQALIDQLQGKPAVTVKAGVTATPGTSIIRVFTDPTPFVHDPNATYKILVNGQTNGFRHEHVPDTEAMIQKLGAANGFDVEIWDRPTGQGPGRPSPAVVSLATSPFMSLDTLKQYKTLVFDSTVGRDPGASLNATEFANLQAYIRAGGGFVAIHGATDAYQNVPWYVDLDGGGFSGHGNNAVGIMPDCMSCGEVELINADPAHPATKHLPPRFTIHDELYNTSRNPVELGLVHPLVFMNEATLVGQINYSPGPLMNSDRHAMIWCRNFEGGRSFTTVIGHSWALTLDDWYQQMLLKAIQTTAGVVEGNCVTYNEVADLVAASVASGGLNSAGSAALSAPLSSAKAEYEKGNYKGPIPYLNTFVSQTEKQTLCRNAAGACPDNGAALSKLHAKGMELLNWMKGL